MKILSTWVYMHNFKFSKSQIVVTKMKILANSLKLHGVISSSLQPEVFIAKGFQIDIELVVCTSLVLQF